jgi:hypothetical protein
MRTDTTEDSQKVTYIQIDGRNIGSCNSNGKDCTFYDCALNHNDDHLREQIIRSSKQGKVKVQVQFSDYAEKYPKCDWKDSNEKIRNVQAVVRFSLYPIEGIHIFTCQMLH